MVGICAFLAAVVTIIGYFGIHPSIPTPVKPPPKSPQAPTVTDTDPPKTDLTQPDTNGAPPSKVGPGTFHLDGGFGRGQAMMTKDALAASQTLTSLTLTNSANNKEEKISEVLVAYPIDAGHAVGLWRKGMRFVNGIQLAGPRHIRLGGAGFESIEIPTDDSGRLQVNVVWPLANMFLEVEYPGPVKVRGGPELSSLLFGDSKTAESGKTLPVEFSFDIPKTGEVIGAIKGQLVYQGGGHRLATIEAGSSGSEPPITWNAEADSAGKAVLRSSKADLVRQGISSLKILYSK